MSSIESAGPEASHNRFPSCPPCTYSSTPTSQNKEMKQHIIYWFADSSRVVELGRSKPPCLCSSPSSWCRPRSSQCLVTSACPNALLYCWFALFMFAASPPRCSGRASWSLGKKSLVLARAPSPPDESSAPSPMRNPRGRGRVESPPSRQRALSALLAVFGLNLKKVIILILLS